MIARADFNRLLERDGGRKASLYMPRHIGGRDEIAEAGRDGRVDTLILADTCEAQIEDTLLDTALSLSVRNGGRAHILPQGMMPAQAPAAAIFRY